MNRKLGLTIAFFVFLLAVKGSLAEISVWFVGFDCEKKMRKAALDCYFVH
jgi:hypothetical protein